LDSSAIVARPKRSRQLSLVEWPSAVIELAVGRIMAKWVGVVGTLFAVTTAMAQTPPPVPRLPPARVVPPSAYCLAASAAFLESESKASDELKKCARGDTVVIPAKSASAVAQMCDFSKAIVTTNDHVVCVIVGSERVSK
jgi:hypothetical protein